MTTPLPKAALYDHYRLPYAPAAVAELLSRLGLAPIVADIGAGTGQLARLFAGRSTKVYVVEPDPAMRRVVAAALAGLTSVELLPASAEHTTLADARLDLIIIGNAFLRFPPEACDELRRILCPHGWIALFTYKFLNTACSEMLFPRLATLPGMTRRIDQAWRRLPMQALFGQAIIQTLSHRQAHTQDWTAFFGAACSGIEAPKPGDPDYAAFEAINREVFDAFAVEGQFQMDFETRVEFGQPRTP